MQRQRLLVTALDLICRQLHDFEGPFSGRGKFGRDWLTKYIHMRDN